MGPDHLGCLLDAHGAALTLYARQWCAAAEDAVQEAFLKLAARTPPPADVVPWLYSVTRNLARTAGRSERRRRHHETVAATRTPTWFAPAEAGPLDAAAATTALAALPEDEREVVVARIWGGLNFEQIGKLTETSAPTAYRRFTAGLARIREHLRLPCPNTPKIPISPR
jgi:RNA polymerase sigma-70 factor (ECF subfamily)